MPRPRPTWWARNSSTTPDRPAGHGDVLSESEGETGKVLGPELPGLAPRPGKSSQECREHSFPFPAQGIPPKRQQRLRRRKAGSGQRKHRNCDNTACARNGNRRAGDSPRRSSPRGNFVNFDHSAFRLSHPDSGGGNLDEATRQLIESIRDSNPGLRQASNAVNLTVGGRAAKSVEMLGASAIYEGSQPIPERIRLVALHGKGGVVLDLVFVAPDADFDTLRLTFDRVLGSFTAR